MDDWNIKEGISNLITDSSIPTPIKKNMFKAFDRLCTALMNIPIAYLEGKAAEIRALSEARQQMIKLEGQQITEGINVNPEYSQLAMEKFGQQIVGEQINLDKISKVAANEIKQNLINSNSEIKDNKQIPLINDDWLNNFRDKAKNKSSEEMQFLFGKILAEEIQSPNSFSIKTVNLLAELDSGVARLFSRFCSFCIAIPSFNNSFNDVRLVSFDLNPDMNQLEDYCIRFTDINILKEYGLILPLSMTYMDYCAHLKTSVKFHPLPFLYRNCYYAFMPLDNRSPNFGSPTGEQLRINGIALSHCGKELFRICKDSLDSTNTALLDKYTKALHEYFSKKKLSMIEVPKEWGLSH